MSLKAFHVAFIVLAIALAGWVAVWAWGEGGGYTALAAASALAGLGLVAYLVRFLRKMRGVSYL
jgi:p-aminobenzoyl-glutamate transporter AbgT